MIPRLNGSKKEALGMGDINSFLVLNNTMSPGSDPSPLVSKSIKFIDYDGTILESYSKKEFLALTEMPENPIHEGMVSRGWNWKLADAKTYVETYGSLKIGQIYGLSDRFIKISIHLLENCLKPFLGLQFNGTIEINWGDGSDLETVSNSNANTVFIPHTYSTPGDYVISIVINSGQSVTICNKGGMCGLLVKSQAPSALYDTGYQNCIRSVSIGPSINGVDTELTINAFCGCRSLETITIDGSLISNIPNNAFQNCASLTSINIPSGITSIGNDAFQSCIALTSIAIPNSVTSIGNNAFYYCYALPSITIPNSVTSIGNNAFNSCDSLTSVIIPDSVISIGDSAFSNCQSLSSITIPNSVTSIGNSAFASCYALTSIAIPNNVTSIGNSVFSYCHSLTSITIPNDVTSIGNNAFNSCQALTSITIPNNVASIGDSAFSYCYSLSSITIPNSVTSIGNSAFVNCYALTSINIPSGITSIGNNVFQYCSALPSITIPSGITSIGQNAFKNCHGLAFIKFEGTTPPTVSNSNTWSGIPTDCIIYAPALVLSAYIREANYPNKSAYAYIGYATYESGEVLPTLTTDQTYTLTWYATPEDAVAQTNPITIGNGSEVYARATTV